VERLPPGAVSAALFEPDLPLRESAGILGPAPPVETGMDRTASAPTGPTTAELLELEIEVRYTLHRAGACLGEPVEIAQEDGNVLAVRGLVASEERRQELLAALAELRGPDWLQVEIETVESALAATSRREPASASASADAGVLTDGYSVQFASGRLPIEDELRSYFADLGDSRAVSDQLAGFTRRAVSESQAALDQAWALRRLADRFGAQPRERLLPRSRWLLNWMINEHMQELERRSQELRGLLLPVLAHVAAEMDLAAGEAAPAESATDGGSRRDENWAAALLQAFESAEEIHRAVLGLFAGAGLTATPAPAVESGAAAEKEAVSSILDRLPELQTEVKAARGQVAAEFASGRAALRSANSRQ
jgi:hypothetical protein